MKNLKKLVLFLALVSTLLICGVMSASAEWDPTGRNVIHSFAYDATYYDPVDRDNYVEKNGVYYYLYQNRYSSTEKVYCAVVNSAEETTLDIVKKIDGIPVEIAIPRYYSGASCKEYEYNGVTYYTYKDVLPARSVRIPSWIKYIYFGSSKFNGEYMYTGGSLVNCLGPIPGTIAKYYTYLPIEFSVYVEDGNPYYERRGNCIYRIEKDGTKKLVHVYIRGLDYNFLTSYSISTYNVDADVREYSHYRSLALPATTKLSDKVKRVEQYAFYGANTEVKLSRNIEYIGYNAFYNCFPDPIRATSGWGRQENDRIDYVLSDTVKYIGKKAFDGNDRVYFLGTKEQFVAAVEGGEIKNCGSAVVYFNCRVDKDFEVVHYDENYDRKCDSCGTSTECDHICHKNNFFSKLCLFFWKLFKINQYCNRCGFEHYHL